MRFDSKFTGFDLAGSCGVYTFSRCGHRIRLLGERLQQLQECLNDPTIGNGKLVALCLTCSLVGIAPVDPTSRTLVGKELEFLRSWVVGWRQMRCGVETCKSRIQVVVVAKPGTTDKEVSAAFVSATIPDGFCCVEGHQIVGLEREP